MPTRHSRTAWSRTVAYVSPIIAMRRLSSRMSDMMMYMYNSIT